MDPKGALEITMDGGEGVWSNLDVGGCLPWQLQELSFSVFHIDILRYICFEKNIF